MLTSTSRHRHLIDRPSIVMPKIRVTAVDAAATPQERP